MDEPTDDALRAIVEDPDGLDGHTIEELADYLDVGRTPVRASIESSPACRHALDALERLRRLTAESLTGPEEQPGDEGWITLVMSQIALDAHAGADLTLATTDPDTVLVMTEGALRALIRATGDDQPEFYVGRIRFTGDLASGTAPFSIQVNVTVMYGVAIPPAAERLRTRILAEVLKHTGCQPTRIDITIEDLDAPRGSSAS